MTLLRRVEAVVERDLGTANDERRALLEAVQRRTSEALRSPSLLVDPGFAEQVSIQARGDLTALESPI